jgi:hypothetical protein
MRGTNLLAGFFTFLLLAQPARLHAGPISPKDIIVIPLLTAHVDAFADAFTFFAHGTNLPDSHTTFAVNVPVNTAFASASQTFNGDFGSFATAFGTEQITRTDVNSLAWQWSLHAHAHNGGTAVINGSTGTFNLILPILPLARTQSTPPLSAAAIITAPGVDTDGSLTLNVGTNGTTLTFSGSFIASNDLPPFVAGLQLDSDELGIHRSFFFDQNLGFQFQGGWGPGNITATQTPDGTVFDLSGLSFTVPGARPSLDTLEINLAITLATPVPEPSTLALFGLGIVGLIAYNRHRRKRQTLNARRGF